MGGLSIWHWLIVLLVVVILFGSKKLPDAARGLGRSMRILKSEMKEMNSEGSSAAGHSAESAPPAQLPQSAPAQQPTAPPVKTEHPGPTEY